MPNERSQATLRRDAVRMLLTLKMSDDLFRWALKELSRLDEPAELMDPADAVLRHEASSVFPGLKANPKAESGRRCAVCTHPVLLSELHDTVRYGFDSDSVRHSRCDPNTYWDGYNGP